MRRGETYGSYIFFCNSDYTCAPFGAAVVEGQCKPTWVPPNQREPYRAGGAVHVLVLRKGYGRFVCSPPRTTHYALRDANPTVNKIRSNVHQLPASSKTREKKRRSLPMCSRVGAASDVEPSGRLSASAALINRPTRTVSVCRQCAHPQRERERGLHHYALCYALHSNAIGIGEGQKRARREGVRIRAGWWLDA